MGLLRGRIRRNMGPLDQLLRAGIGLGLIWFGFFDDWFITDRVAGALLGAFGIVNLLFAPLAVCPVYLIAGISTCPADNPGGGASSADLRKRMLVATVGLSILVLAIFGLMPYRIAEDASASHAPPVMVGMAERLAARLEQTPPSRIEARLAAIASHSPFFRLRDADGHVVFATSREPQAADLWRAVDEAQSRGAARFEFGDDPYFWVVAQGPESKMQVTLVEPIPRIARSVLESLAMKLSVLGFIVVWIAV